MSTRYQEFESFIYFFNYTDHICWLISPFSANLLYQPVNTYSLKKKTIFDLVIEEVYLTKSKLLINYLHEHSTSADSIHEDFLLFTKNKLTRLWSVWYLELANVELRMMIRYKTSRITLWNAIVTALMYWVCQVESVTSFCCCSFLKFCREPVTAEATEKFSCPFLFQLLLCTARGMLQPSFDSPQMQSIQRTSISTSRPMSLLHLRILVVRVRDPFCFRRWWPRFSA